MIVEVDLMRAGLVPKGTMVSWTPSTLNTMMKVETYNERCHLENEQETSFVKQGWTHMFIDKTWENDVMHCSTAYVRWQVTETPAVYDSQVQKEKNKWISLLTIQEGSQGPMDRVMNSVVKIVHESKDEPIGSLLRFKRTQRRQREQASRQRKYVPPLVLWFPGWIQS
jgi:hypothetical protein